MKQPNILLLDFQPSSELSSALQKILAASRTIDNDSGNPADRSWSRLTNQLLSPQSVVSHHLQADAGGAANELIARLKPAVIFLISPRAVLRQIKLLFQSLRPTLPAPQIIVVSDADAPDEIFEFVNLGVSDFITPPLKAGNILPRLWGALQRASSNLSDKPVKPFLTDAVQGFKSLIGSSPAFLLQANRIPFIAKCDARVFICGETGTGKEMFARAIHKLSLRADRPFVPLNCGAIPPELFESELFGHERGAFTGAATKREGLVAEADGGTLFLDEIDSLPYYSQVKLLRFLQESEYRPVGSDKNRQANVRIITATNADVDRAVKEEKLRKDLYFRLNIIEMNLPSLRQRREDIELLASHFLKRYAEKFNKIITGFSADALQKLLMYDWPGNVRELENAIERAAAMVESDVITSDDLAIASSAKNESPQPFQEAKRRAIEQFEKTYLQSLLLAYQGNVSHAARAAQKDRSTLLQLLRKYGIKADSFRIKGW